MDDELDDEEEGEIPLARSQKPVRPSKSHRNDFLRADFRDDDMDDFIVDEDDTDDEFLTDEQRASRREAKAAARRRELEMAKQLGDGYGIPTDAVQQLQELFDYGDTYDYALTDEEDGYELDTTAQEIVEDEDGNKVAVRRYKEIRLADVYEPDEIAEKLLTDSDEVIRIKDIPERYQIAKLNESKPDESEINREAKFITINWMRIMNKDPSLKPEMFIPLISLVLVRMRIEYLEVPYIVSHQSDYIEGLNRADLWVILELHDAFVALENKKRNTLMVFEGLAEFSARVASNYDLKRSIELAGTIEEIGDAYQFMKVTYASEIAEKAELSGKKTVFNRTEERRQFDEAKKNGMDDLAKLFNINIRDYVRSITSQQVLHIPDDHHVAPDHVAVDFMKAQYVTSAAALEAARVLLYNEIGTNPELRSFMRKIYSTDAVITVRLTQKGRDDIDQAHPYYCFKYVVDKPVDSFNDGMFLAMMDAESQNLMKLELRVGEEKRLIEDLRKYICNDYFNELAQAWNHERAQVAESAARKILFPHASKWLREKLAAEATDYVSNNCQLAMQSRIAMAPYKVPPVPKNSYGDPDDDDDDDEEDEEVNPKVLGLSWGDGGPQAPIYAAMVNETGNLVKVFTNAKLSEIACRPNNMDYNAMKTVDEFVAFLKEHRPHVIALGGFQCNTLKKLKKFLEDTVSREEETRNIAVLIIEDEAARIFMNSKRGVKEFPDDSHHRLVRYCVSLARKVQDPTSEYAALYNYHKDVLSLPLDPLQHLLPELKLMSAIDRAFINIVNECGVDINLAAEHPHLSYTLQFVSGLGPRKAQFMLARISRMTSKLGSRDDLIQEKLCGPVIFKNSCAFIRIREMHLNGKAYDSFDVLDDTRIHCEDYDFARKMVLDAHDVDDSLLNNKSMATERIRDLMQSGEMTDMSALNLDEYATKLWNIGKVKKRNVLNLIRQEMFEPFKERRDPFVPATPDQVFTMLTGESNETLRPGLILNAEIVNVRDKVMFCKLECGLEGKVFPKHGGVPRDMTMQEVYSSGTVIPVRVLEINKEDLSADFACSERDVDPENAVPPKRDEYFNRHLEDQDLQVAKRSLIKMRKEAVRVIQHPFFKNIDYKRAQVYLASRPRGEVVIRPSNKGNDHLCITWKVDDGIFQHIEVQERNKENEWSIGKTLLIGDLEFREIDHIIAEYIEPMTRRIAQLINHAKYKKFDLKKMQEEMERQYAAVKRSVYGFIISSNKPGHFFLVYRHPQNHVRHDTILVKPDGYEFRKRTHQSIDDMLKFFKEDEMRKSLENKKKQSSGSHLVAGQQQGYVNAQQGPQRGAPFPGQPFPQPHGQHFQHYGMGGPGIVAAGDPRTGMYQAFNVPPQPGFNHMPPGPHGPLPPQMDPYRKEPRRQG